MSPYVIRHGKRIEVETLNTGVAAKTKRKKAEPFAIVPLHWAAKAASATRAPAIVVCIYLLHAAWRAKGEAFTLSNGALAKAGVNRETKRRILRDLEIGGLIAVERGRGRSARVTLLSDALATGGRWGTVTPT